MSAVHFTWYERAESVIRAVEHRLPANTTLAERTKAIDEAGAQFGGSWPRKAWLRARRIYLGRYGYRGRGASAALLPIEAAAAE